MNEGRVSVDREFKRAWWIITRLGCLIFFIGTLVLAIGCGSISMPSPPPTVPSDTPISELKKMVIDTSLGWSVRFDAAKKLGERGPAAAPAVPELTQALALPSHDVRAAAAEALGKIGPEAAPAIPSLIKLLSPDNDYTVRGEAAWALGRIGPLASSAVPELAKNLSDEHTFVRGRAAWAIAKITGNRFPDADGDGNGFAATTDNKELFIVIAAREWWKTKGQYQDWEKQP